MISDAESKAIFIAPMVFSPISLVASATLVVMILRSQLKLTVPLRRVIFGLCCYDVLQSASSGFSSAPIPKGQGFVGAIGNVYTCNVQGFIMHLGTVGSLLYSCSMSIYYVCVIRFSITETTFATKVEPFLHIVANLYPIIGAIFFLNGKYFNSIDTMCWISSYPPECMNDEDVQCTRGGKHAYFYRWIFVGFAVVGVFVILCVNYFLIVWVVIKQGRQMKRWSLGHPAGISSKKSALDCFSNSRFVRTKDDTNRASGNQQGEGQVTANDHSHLETQDILVEEKRRKFKPSRTSSTSLGQDPSHFDLEAMRSKVRENQMILLAENKQPSVVALLPEEKEAIFPIGIPSTNKEKKRAPPSAAGTASDPYRFNLSAVRAKVQGGRDPSQFNPTSSISHGTTRGPMEVERAAAISQSLLYITSFLTVWAFPAASRIVEHQRTTLPFVVLFLARVLHPLQGLFDIILYCRPHVLSLRIRQRKYSWFKLIWETIKTGGDNNEAGMGRRSHRGGRRASQKVIDKIHENHALKMQQIRERKVKMEAAVQKRASVCFSAADGNDYNFDSDDEVEVLSAVSKAAMNLSSG